MSELELSIEEIVSDVLDFVPNSKIFKLAIQQVFKKRLSDAREILIEEIRDGNKTVVDAIGLDDMVAIVYRYGRAAQEGTARLNLRLLAQVVGGKKISEKLTANKFLYYADIISSLTVEEINLLGRMLRERKLEGYQEQSLFEQEHGEKSSEVLQSLVRTGLVAFEQSISVRDQDDWKATDKYITSLDTQYYLTSLMHEVCKFVSFEEVIKKESSNSSRRNAA
jgi:hypothetical protein